MAGLTTAGLEIKRAADIVSELNNDVRSPDALGPAASVSPAGPLGQLIGIFSTQLGEAWELLQDLYDSFDPDSAQGEALDNLSALTRVTRIPAEPSVGFVTLSGTAGTVVPAGTRFSSSSTGEEFELLDDATIGALGSVSASVASVDTGPIQATAGTIDTIVNPISGLNTVTNSADLTEGRDVETDLELRLRRESELEAGGSNGELAIRQKLLEDVDDIIAAVVSSNRNQDPVDAFGTPLNQIQVWVWPGVSIVDIDQVVTALYESVPAGIQTYGTILRDVVDDQGFIQEFAFSVASEQQLHFDIQITTLSDFPADGEDQIKDHVDGFVATLSVGDELRVHEVSAAIESGVASSTTLNGVDGLDTIEVRVKVGGAPGGADIVNIELNPNQIFTTQIADIDVTDNT